MVSRVMSESDEQPPPTPVDVYQVSFDDRMIPFPCGKMRLRTGQILSINETPEWQGPTVIVRKILRHPGPDGDGEAEAELKNGAPPDP